MNIRVSSAPVTCFTNLRQDLLDFPCIFSFFCSFPFKRSVWNFENSRKCGWCLLPISLCQLLKLLTLAQKQLEILSVHTQYIVKDLRFSFQILFWPVVCNHSYLKCCRLAKWTLFCFHVYEFSAEDDGVGVPEPSWLQISYKPKVP